MPGTHVAPSENEMNPSSPGWLLIICAAESDANAKPSSIGKSRNVGM